MTQLLVRGLDDRIVETLRHRARRLGTSVEAEHRSILERALAPEAESFADMAARIRRAGPRLDTSSAELIRADRDRDHPSPP